MRFLVLALVLMSSAAKAEFYLEGGISYLQDQGSLRTTELTFKRPTGTLNGVLQYEDVTATTEYYRTYDISYYCNPYGDIAIGYDYRWRKFSLDLQAAHRSGACHDHGQNYLRFSIRWYPFH